MKKRGWIVISLVMILFAAGGLLLLKDNSKGERYLDSCGEIRDAGSYIVNMNLSGTGSAIICFNITSSNVEIDGRGNSLLGAGNDSYLAFYIFGVENVTIKNISIIDYGEGVYAGDSKNIAIINSRFISDFYGIILDSTNNSRVVNNNLDSCGSTGISVYGSKDAYFFGNKVSESISSLSSDENENLSFDSNTFSQNLRPFIKITRDSPIIEKGKSTKFAVTFSGEIDNSSETHKIELFPNEESMNLSKDGDVVGGEFTPTRTGIYSLTAEASDSYNNTYVTRAIYLSSPSEEASENYYLRGEDPGNSQERSWGPYRQDSGSLLREKPVQNESRGCLNWVVFFPDELPKYLLGVVKEINFSMRYSENSNGAFVGVQKIATFGEDADYKIPVGNTGGKEVLRNYSFNVTWGMKYFWSWYFMDIKLSAENGDPQININPSDPARAEISYIYSSTPAITMIGNKQTLVLSATMEDNSDTAQIILDGAGRTELGLKMPKNSIYSVSYNGLECNSPDCRVESQSGGEINLSLNADGINDIEISPAKT